LRTIAVYVLGAWLVATGLDWSIMVAMKEEMAIFHGWARALILLLGIWVLFKAQKP
jgi:hypothetical protein